MIVGRQIVEAYGGEVIGLDEVKGLSTTQIIQRIMESHNETAAASAPARLAQRRRK